MVLVLLSSCDILFLGIDDYLFTRYLLMTVRNDWTILRFLLLIWDALNVGWNGRFTQISGVPVITGLRVETASQLLCLFVDAVLSLSLCLDLQVLYGQINDLVPQSGLFNRVRWRCKISNTLKPEEVLVVIVFTLRLFVIQVLEAR